MNNDDPKLRALTASAEAVPTSDPRYQRGGARRWRVFQSDPRPHPRARPTTTPPMCGRTGRRAERGGDDRWPFILQNPADRFEHRRHRSRQPLDCRAGRNGCVRAVAQLASLGTSLQGRRARR